MSIDRRDFFASEAMKVLLAHHLRSPLNLTIDNANFDMIDMAGGISAAAFELADHMLHHSVQRHKPTTNK